MFVLAGLDESKLAAIQQFERESGLKVLAFSPMRVNPATVSNDILERLQELEQKLGVCLLAVE